MEQIELNDAALAAIEKVRKLLALAKDKGASEGEATNAMAMASRILEQHNLDMALVERTQGQAGTPHAKRDDKVSGGGLYKWQRGVWEATAKLNMCVYFSIRGLGRGTKYENRVIGRPENVIMTTVMAEYLQQAIERLAAEWAKDQGYSSRFVREAIIYREGMADRIQNRLWTLQYDRKRESQNAKEAQASSGAPGTALVLVDVISNEEDLNNDYLNNLEPGTTAKRRHERDIEAKRWGAEQAVKNAMHESRLQLDPEYAEQYRLLQLAEKKADEAWNKKYGGRAGRAYRETATDRRRNHSAYGEGYERGASVSLDRQVGGEGTDKRLK